MGKGTFHIDAFVMEKERKALAHTTMIPINDHIGCSHFFGEAWSHPAELDVYRHDEAGRGRDPERKQSG
jgi:hypothetical protein